MKQANQRYEWIISIFEKYFLFATSSGIFIAVFISIIHSYIVYDNIEVDHLFGTVSISLCRTPIQKLKEIILPTMESANVYRMASRTNMLYNFNDGLFSYQ